MGCNGQASLCLWRQYFGCHSHPLSWDLALRILLHTERGSLAEVSSTGHSVCVLIKFFALKGFEQSRVIQDRTVMCVELFCRSGLSIVPMQLCVLRPFVCLAPPNGPEINCRSFAGLQQFLHVISYSTVRVYDGQAWGLKR